MLHKKGTSKKEINLNDEGKGKRKKAKIENKSSGKEENTISIHPDYSIIKVYSLIGKPVNDYSSIYYLTNEKEKHSPEVIENEIKSLKDFGMDDYMDGLIAIKNNNYLSERYIDSDTISVIELYGRYVSRQHQLTQPIFSYADYQSAGIMFHVFCIEDVSRKGIGGLLFFDNYETINKETFALRFVWWQPGYEAEDHIDSLKRIINEKLAIPQEQLILKPTSFVRRFTQSPITLSYNDLLPEITLDTYPQIEVPILDAQAWKNLTPITDEQGNSPFGQEYICLLATGNIPQSVQMLAKRYENYLRPEAHYDSSVYHGSKENEHDIYFIVKADYSYCIGIFIFVKAGKIDYSDYFEEGKAQLKIYKTHRVLNKDNEPEDLAPSFFKAKYERNLKKYEKASEKIGYDIMRISFDKKVRKYKASANLYRKLGFFAYAEQAIPANTNNITLLQAAWMHPFHRCQGFLTKLWPSFQKNYGVFDIDNPSKAMQGFLDKQNIGRINFQNGHYLVA